MENSTFKQHRSHGQVGQ